MRETGITVLGAGVIGLCCALALQRDGFSVTLLDGGEPGMGCSFGNAGMIHTGAIMPLAQPGIVGQMPRMLMDPEGPLVLPLTNIPRLLPWLLAFASAARRQKAAATARLMAGLLRAAKPAYDDLLDATEKASLFRARGELYVFGDEAGYRAAAAKFPLYSEHGVNYVELGDAALHDFEPALSQSYRHGYYLPDSEYVIDPLTLSQQLFSLFVKAGGIFERYRVETVRRRDGGGFRLLAQGGERACERLVLAAGAASGKLAAALGVHVHLQPLRGYHLMMEAAGLTLAGPVIEGSLNIAATPMSGGIRLAGTLEFSRPSEPPRWRRAEMLSPMARRMLPALSEHATARWAGDRPGTPDGLPVIGPAAGVPGLWCAFGHGMLGLTLAAVTARIIADDIMGKTAPADLAAFGAGRFSSSRQVSPQQGTSERQFR